MYVAISNKGSYLNFPAQDPFPKKCCAKSFQTPPNPQISKKLLKITTGVNVITKIAPSRKRAGSAAIRDR
jgi:hypothetical protein